MQTHAIFDFHMFGEKLGLGGSAATQFEKSTVILGDLKWLTPQPLIFLSTKQYQTLLILDGPMVHGSGVFSFAHSHDLT